MRHAQCEVGAPNSTYRQEARNERRRRRELNELFELKMARIEAAQARNDEMIDRLGAKVDKLSDKIDRLVDSALHPGNGHQQ